MKNERSRKMKSLKEILESLQPKAKEGFEWIDEVPDRMYQNPDTKPISGFDLNEWVNASAGIDRN